MHVDPARAQYLADEQQDTCRADHRIGNVENGSVIVGNLLDTTGSHAFRWTQAEGVQLLGTMGGPSERARGASADGSVVVGDWLDTSAVPVSVPVSHVYRWTQSEGGQDLGTLGGKWAFATGVSGDGSVIVGGFGDTNGVVHVFRWTKSEAARDP